MNTLVLAPDAAIDLQLHTHYSDGTWTPDALTDHLVAEGFGLAAVTDHDTADQVAAIQQIAAAKGLPMLAAVEMTTIWRDQMVDVLCYGFDPHESALHTLARDVMHRQQHNSRDVLDALLAEGYSFPDDPGAFEAVLQTPSAAQQKALLAFVQNAGYGTAEKSAGKIIVGAGSVLVMTDLATVVEAAHQSGGVCLIAHPGRGDYYPLFDAELLDQIRADVPLDGFEAYYPKHSAEQIAMYEAYAQQHNLLISAGSDSHGADHYPPIKYPAGKCRALLERLGIEIKA